MSRLRHPSCHGRAIGGVAAAGVAFMLLPAGASALGTAGGLDPTFNGGAPVVSDLAKTSPRQSGFAGLVVDGSGRLVVGGNATDEIGKTAALMARYNPDGSPDTTFNGTGVRLQNLGTGVATTTSPSAPFSFSYGPFLIPGGGLGFPIYRTKADGRMDQAAMTLTSAGLPNLDLGSGGFLSTQPSPSPDNVGSYTGVAGADGSIFVGGTLDNPSYKRKFAITKFTAQGQAASGFGAGGSVLATYSESTSDPGTYPGPMVALPSNRLLISGTTTKANGRAVPFVARLNAQNGAPDPTFGTSNGGTVVHATDAGGTDAQGLGLAVGPDNSIYQSGTADDNQDRGALMVIRYSPSGTPDPTFAQGGVKRIQLSPGTDRQDRSSGSAIAVQPDGKVLVVGQSARADYSAEAVAVRLRTDGSLDPTFGTGGVARFQLSTAATPSTSFSGAAIVGGRLYVSGSVRDGIGGSRALLASILLEPLPDPPAPVAQSASAANPGPVPAVPAAAAAAPGVAVGPGTLTLVGTKLRLGTKGAPVAVGVKCVGGPCSGTLSLVSRTGKLVGPFKKREKKAVTFGSARYAVGAGQAATLGIAPSKAARSGATGSTLKIRLALTPSAGAASVVNATLGPAKAVKKGKGKG